MLQTSELPRLLQPSIKMCRVRHHQVKGSAFQLLITKLLTPSCDALRKLLQMHESLAIWEMSRKHMLNGSSLTAERRGVPMKHASPEPLKQNNFRESLTQERTPLTSRRLRKGPEGYLPYQLSRISGAKAQFWSGPYDRHT